ncbi:MAG: serine/threonine-protein kinase, partial [bacterium]
MDKSEIAEIGKYKILGQIGEGAMGVVYRALDPVLNRAVAIKVMSDSLARDAELRARFLREAQSAGSLQHPNVITIYDFGEVDGHPFIAMEFVEGSDLNELLANKSPMTILEKLDVLIDVLNGLSYAHKRGIVHRDIKPANIRIDEDGRARVMDFGIAHLSSSNMTRTGVMVGTPAYMCPEQITGGEISPASDLFAVGAVMYELLTGVQAFRGESLQTVMYKIVSAPTPDLKLSATGLSPERSAVVTRALNTIVTKALEKDVVLRYQSALDMSADLSDVRTRLIDVNDPIRTTSLRATVAKAMANTEEIKLRKRRNRLAGAGAGAVLIIALGWTALSWSRRSATIADPPPTIATQPAAPLEHPVATAKTQSPTPPPAAPSAEVVPAKSAVIPTPTARELAVYRSLQLTALEARRRAADAGATAENLGAGDGHNRLANALVLEGKTVAAGDHLSQATIQWSAAERNARAASSALVQTSRANPVEATKPQA